MTAEAPAKINLGLHVLRGRGDGYHDIETVMIRIGWYDTIEVAHAAGIGMSCTEPDLPLGADNLCVKAALALRAEYGIAAGAHLHLTKRIPSGAGLGGGSSDAAATLRLLSQFWGLHVSNRELAEIGARIGADVPFFLGPSPALAEGKGERLSAVPSERGGPLHLPFTFVVFKPRPSVSTADAYRWVEPSKRDRPNLRELVRSFDLDRWKAELKNDFEDAVAARVPEIDRIKSRLYEAGAGFAAMSGSGTAVFGVFEDVEAASRAAASFETADYVCWMGKAV